MSARTPASDTATRIQAVALELFSTQGYDKTSLREIADRLRLTKPASTLALLDLGTRVTDWRRRILTLLVEPDPSPAEQARAIVAIGGLADCTVMFPHVPAEELRVAAVDAACATLGLPVEPT